MAEIKDFAVLAANNTARWPEGQLVPTLNDAGREDEAIIARWFRDTNGSITSSGTASAYAILTNRVIPEHAAGNIFRFRAHLANDGAATITINALASKALKRMNGDALVTGDIVTNQMVEIVYNPAQDWYEVTGVNA